MAFVAARFLRPHPHFCVKISCHRSRMSPMRTKSAKITMELLKNKGGKVVPHLPHVSRAGLVKF